MAIRMKDECSMPHGTFTARVAEVGIGWNGAGRKDMGRYHAKWRATDAGVETGVARFCVYMACSLHKEYYEAEGEADRSVVEEMYKGNVRAIREAMDVMTEENFHDGRNSDVKIELSHIANVSVNGDT